MDQFHGQLVAEKEKMRELAKLTKEQEALTKELNGVRRKERTYKRKLDEEKIDVEKLEGFSIAGLFLALAGKKDERLDQEKQEVLAAQLKWKEAQESIADLELDIKQLEGKIKSLGDPEATYQQLLLDKQDYLIHSGQQEGHQALNLIDKIGGLNSDVKEIKEALEAGKHARSALADASESLNKAKNWGTFDMFGGGVISTSIKHGHIDSAKEQVHRAQRLLRKFSYELDDIGHKFEANLSVSGGLTFMDYFFDGLISDWLVQDKINNSYQEVDKMYRETDSTLNKLELLLDNTKKTVQRLKVEWENLVTLG
ncbi:hypothetical protein [Aquibacillus kalidii]|uniref:hypothetical protein n=1 Tax=Aquibacillus kalidii TaxID=2762597 RepID=UPI001646890E|nr:hypothetical protein [Aquibacillus kalidii]